MEVLHKASAGTNGNNDIVIVVEPGNGVVDIKLESVMGKRYDNLIRSTILKSIKELNVTSVNVYAIDNGALDYTISARVEAAIKRAAAKEV